MTFLEVMGKNAPAFTVASLAIIMTRRVSIRARPVITPAAGAPPHSSYMPWAANSPNSKKLPASTSRSIRSRPVLRPLLCWLSIALAPPPSQIFSPSLRTCDIRSARNRMLASKRAEVGSVFVGKTLDVVSDFSIGDSRRSGMVEGSGLITVYQRRGRAQTRSASGRERSAQSLQSVKRLLHLTKFLVLPWLAFPGGDRQRLPPPGVMPAPP